MYSDRAGTSVLIIDGDDNDRQYYAQRLRLSSPDYAIIESPNAENGLHIYNSQSVDCVVLELILPDASGFEVLLRLVPVPSRCEVAVVVLTKLTSPSVLELAVQNGAHTALKKVSTTGEILCQAILNAVSVARRDGKS